MSIPYTLKVNERLTASPIVGEAHVVGIIGITTYAPGKIRLVEVPQFSFPFSTVSIPGYTEIPSGTPIGTEFVVNYETGVINFSPVHDGSAVSVSYAGLGSEIAAEDINELQEPLNSIAQLSLTYNWPLAPTVSWSLASGLAVTSLNGLANNVTLVAGTNITLSQVGQAITVNSTGVNGISSLTGDVTTSPINNPLGSASAFAVLANSTVTNTGLSVLTGDLGLKPGTSVTGFPPGTYTGTTHIADLTASIAQNDAANAYNYLAALPFPPGVYPSGNNLSGQDLGGKNPAPGVYNFSSSAALTGTLTLTGTAADVWVFQIGSTLSAASGSNIILSGGALARNVYWVVGSSATLNSTASFLGTIIVQASITLVTGASNNGSLIALTGAVTLDDNAISATGWASGTLATVVDVGGSSAANVHSAELLANASTSLNTLSTIVKRDGSGNFSAGTITATLSGHATLDLALTGGTMTGSLGIGEAPFSSAILDLGSTTQGFLPPRMTTTQMSAIVSPVAGLMVFTTDTQQWMGFDGNIWVILG